MNALIGPTFGYKRSHPCKVKVINPNALNNDIFVFMSYLGTPLGQRRVAIEDWLPYVLGGVFEEVCMQNIRYQCN